MQEVHEKLDAGDPLVCGRNAIVIINNNLHEAVANEGVFGDTKRRLADLRGLVEHARRRCGSRILWRTPNQIADYAKGYKGSDTNTVTFEEAVNIDAKEVIPRLQRDLVLPMLDAYAITNQAAGDLVDHCHYRMWELEHEVHALLSQLECLHRSGYWADEAGGN